MLFGSNFVLFLEAMEGHISIKEQRLSIMHTMLNDTSGLVFELIF